MTRLLLEPETALAFASAARGRASTANWPSRIACSVSRRSTKSCARGRRRGIPQEPEHDGDSAFEAALP